MPDEVRAFCLPLMWGGCRISEALAVTPPAIDWEAGTISFFALKRRSTVIVRQVPLRAEVLADLANVFDLSIRERYSSSSAPLLELEPHHRKAPHEGGNRARRNFWISGNAQGLAACLWRSRVPIRPPAHRATIARPRVTSHDRNLWECQWARGTAVRTANLG